MFFLGATVLFTIGPVFLTNTGEAMAAASTCQLSTSAEYPIIASDCAVAGIINAFIHAGAYLNFTIPLGIAFGIVGLLWLFVAMAKRVVI